MKTSVRLAALVSILVLSGLLRADVALPRIFGDNMVLQREMAVPVWGHAAPGETVTVRFAGQEKQARADAEGRWALTLAALPASADAREMTVSAGNIVRLRNVLVGEVWLCSGQSNMEYAVGVAKKWAPAAAASDPELAQELIAKPLPTLRLFRVEKELKPPEVVSSGWQEAAGAARDEFSAVGYYFGRRLRRELGVPIGMIQSAWGGSRIEEWTPRDAYAKLAAVFTGDAAGSFERDAAMVGRNYEAMVRPLAPFALRGVIWYQGESNLIAYNDGLRYADKMRVFIDSWRSAWNRTETATAAGAGEAMPFYFVQIAPYRYTSRQDKLQHSVYELPRLWEAQAAALQIPDTGMVPTTDLVDDVNNIHPAHKREVGDRLASLALARTYGCQGMVWAGPMFARLEVHGADVTVHFQGAGDGLAARDGKRLTDFEIAGADGGFVPATAVICGDTIVVSSPLVKAPAVVRFGWTETARPNLTNRAGLPACPFCSDTGAR
jgi:sialate O-acetylesterase